MKDKREEQWNKDHARLVGSGKSPLDAYVEANRLESDREGLKKVNKKQHTLAL